jgi:hypothetical protein
MTAKTCFFFMEENTCYAYCSMRFNHGRRINKNDKDESSLHFGLAVFCRFEARVGECYVTYISVPVAILGGRQLYVDLFPI